LPRKGTRHKTSGVEIGYRHEYISPQMSFATVLLPVAGSYLHKKKSSATTIKNVATSDIFVAIDDFLATFWFSWQ
jgi:hypothetical protein